MSESQTLRILLLGSSAILVGEQPFTIQRRLLRWLLAYLACQHEMVGRADLILLFWPDEAEEDARRHLREVLSKLRSQLPDPNLIITDQDRVGLDPNLFYSDALEFQALFSQTARACAQTDASTPLTQAVHQKVVEAVRLWRSARFMAGANLPESENLVDWLLMTSQQFETQRARLLDRLVDHDIASGDVEGAIHWLQSALEGDETNETLHYRLLNLLHKQGRYSEALNYCSYLRELFQREGFSELPPALASLSRQIREEAAQPAPDSQRPAWPSLANMQVPFVGRQPLMKDMQFAARRGNPVILFGEAGSGKSRLVRELFFSLKPAPRLLLAPAWNTQNSLPFQPIVDMLRHDIRAEEWKQMDLVWLTPLVLLLPELCIMRPEIQPPQVAAYQERGLIFEALRQLFLFLGKKQRYLLLLDNAQWSDEGTLSALTYLAERGLCGEHGALIVTARMEEMTPQLESFLNRSQGPYSVQRFSLPALDTEEIAGLSRYILGDSFTPSIVPRLERETGGNPLFLLETLRLVLDYSLSQNKSTPTDRLPLASAIHTLIRERLQHLSPYDSQVLSIAAVVGNEFSTKILEACCNLPPEQVAQSLESLAQVNLIQAVLRDSPSSEYMFMQEKVREVALLDLSPARKRLFHLRVARALDQQQGQSPEMEAMLAAHYEEAGELNDAFQHWLRTGLYAWRIRQAQGSVDALKRAEQIIQRLDHQASDIAVYQLYHQWGRLASNLGEVEMMEQVYQLLLQSGQRRQNPMLVGAGYLGLAQAAELRWQPGEGADYLDQAAPFLEQTDRLFEHIEAQGRRAAFQMQNRQFLEAQKILQSALSTAGQINNTQGLEARALAEYWQSVLLLLSGWPLLSLEMAILSMRDSEEAFDPHGAARAICAQANANFFLGRVKEGLALVEQALSAAEEMSASSLAAEIHATAARGYFSTGNFDQGWHHLQKADETNRQIPSFIAREALPNLRWSLLEFFGDELAVLNIFQETDEETSPGYDQRIHRATALAKCGDTHQSLEMIEEYIIDMLRSGLMLYYLIGQIVKADILIHGGRLAAARAILEFVISEARQRSLLEIAIRAELLAGEAALAEGQVSQAIQSACQCVDFALSRGRLLVEVQGYELWLRAAGHNSPTAAENADPSAASGLQSALEAIAKRTNIQQLRTLLLKKYPCVDKIP